MDLAEFRKHVEPKIESRKIVREVRDELDKYKRSKQDVYESGLEAYKPILESQTEVKKTIDRKQDEAIEKQDRSIRKQDELIRELREGQESIVRAIEDIDKGSVFGNLFDEPKAIKGVDLEPPTTDGGEEEKNEWERKERNEWERKEKEKGEEEEEKKKTIFPNKGFPNEALEYLVKVNLPTPQKFYESIITSKFPKEKFEGMVRKANEVKGDVGRRKGATMRSYQKIKSKEEREKKVAELDATAKLLDDYIGRIKAIYEGTRMIEEQEGSGVRFFNNPRSLLDRLELLGGSIVAGNDSAKSEFSEIAHVLWKLGLISNNALKHLLQGYII